MGGIAPSAAMTALQIGMNVAQQEAAYSAQKNDAKAQANQIRQAAENENRLRQERLRRALASQRARFGAQGLSTSGSANAVLEGLAAEANRQALDAETLAGYRLGRISAQVADTRRKNLLAASQTYSRYAFNTLQRDLQTTPLLEY